MNDSKNGSDYFNVIPIDIEDDVLNFEGDLFLVKVKNVDEPIGSARLFNDEYGQICQKK